ncbi:MAG: Crp/Fnr family transcriptional regulator [Burkholderiaceae bacterium]|nr:Crp/Fnr family transcriptional regulator [Burkholderiaceae bacterium]
MNLDADSRLGQLAKHSPRRRYRKGAIIVNEGAHGGDLYALIAGRVRVFSTSVDGREITFGEYEPFTVIGEMSLDGGPRSASVEAIEPSEFAIITRESLIAQIRESPDLAIELITLVIQRARASTESTRSLALLDVYSRLRELIERDAVPGPDGVAEHPRAQTHRVIASKIGASREMVSRLLKDLERGGYVELVGRRLRVLRRLPERW